MATLEILHPHTLGKTQAIHKLGQGLAELEDKGELEGFVLPTSLDTQTFMIKAYNVEVRGTLVVTDTTVEIKAKLPLWASMFSSVIEQKLTDYLRKILDNVPLPTVGFGWPNKPIKSKRP